MVARRMGHHSEQCRRRQASTPGHEEQGYFDYIRAGCAGGLRFEYNLQLAEKLHKEVDNS